VEDVVMLSYKQKLELLAKIVNYHHSKEWYKERQLLKDIPFDRKTLSYWKKTSERRDTAEDQLIFDSEIHPWDQYRRILFENIFNNNGQQLMKTLSDYDPSDDVIMENGKARIKGWTRNKINDVKQAAKRWLDKHI
jgi:hypothetical protein